MSNSYVLSDGSSIEVITNDLDAVEVKTFMLNIVRERGWEPPANEFDAYNVSSKYVIHYFEKKILGAAKLTLARLTKMIPMLDIWPGLPITAAENIAELSVLALAPEARGRGLSFLPIAAETWRYCYSQNVTELWAVVEPRMLPIYRRFGWPFEIVGELKEHWGVPSYPCKMCLMLAGKQFFEYAQKRKNLIYSFH